MIINFHPKPGMIPALTISQPWARLIMNGTKLVENRIWKTDYRGPLAIHAGSGTQYLDRRQLRALETGCVVAIAQIVDCVPLAELQKLWNWEHPQFQFMSGPWCWILEKVQRVDFYPIPGKLGLWPIQADLLTISKDQSPIPINYDSLDPEPVKPPPEVFEPARTTAERQRKLF